MYQCFSWYLLLVLLKFNLPVFLWITHWSKWYNDVASWLRSRLHAVCENAVASAQFIHVLAQGSLRIVLYAGRCAPGLFGETCDYRMKDQGRLALHLHLLLWIKGSLQQMQDQLLNDTATFRNAIIQWLESYHSGELQTGNLADIHTSSPIEDDELHPNHPTAHLSQHPSAMGTDNKYSQWWQHVQLETDEIVYQSNYHSPLHNKGCKASAQDECCAILSC